MDVELEEERKIEKQVIQQLRPLLKSDQDKLWHWLHVALWDPPPADLRPITVLDAPGVRIYAEHWGEKKSDCGVVLNIEGQDAGACWMRLMPEGIGLAFVDSNTPQLGIALEKEFQHKRYGEVLLNGALAAAKRQGYTSVSLTVHPENKGAITLYKKCGFLHKDTRNTFYLMVVDL
jgi:RimJ/RimL family protein N-acetyltransferase